MDCVPSSQRFAVEQRETLAGARRITVGAPSRLPPPITGRDPEENGGPPSGLAMALGSRVTFG